MAETYEKGCIGMTKVVVIDGQGGRMGGAFIEQWKKKGLPGEIYALGTNSIATAAMLRSGADYGASGENPIIVHCRDAALIIGPLGIVIADALLGEITPAIALAVGQSPAQKLLLPVNRCGQHVVGVGEHSLATLIELALQEAERLLG